MGDRRYEVGQRCQQAIRVLRDAEDWALLELGDPALASRFRESYECITERVLNGKYGEGLSRRKMRDVIEWVDHWAWDTLPQRRSYDHTLDEGPHHIGPYRVNEQAGPPPEDAPPQKDPVV